MTRNELFEHMLSDSYHSRNRKMYLKELRDKGAWEGWRKQTLRAGTIRAKHLHDFDHAHPEHEHES